MLKISKGRIPRALKIVIYGPEGIGKSSLASAFPSPLFIDTEGGTAQMDVNRVDKPNSWVELVDIVKEVAVTPDCCRTLVIDTADWAERMCIDYICQKYSQQGLESFGYGKGYTYLAEEWNNLMTACDKVIKNGMNVCFVAHAKQRKQELPDEAGAFDRWELKLSKQVAPILKEWSDTLLFANYKSYVIKGKTEMDKNKISGGKRMLFTTHHPCWDAKNRFNLPDELDLGFEGIAHIFGDVPKPLSPLEELRKRMDDDGISDLEIQKLVSAKGHFSDDTEINDYPVDFIKGWLLPNWAAISRDILDNPTAPF